MVCFCIPQKISPATAYVLLFIESVLLGMLVAGMPAYFAMEHMRDQEVSANHWTVPLATVLDHQNNLFTIDKYSKNVYNHSNETVKQRSCPVCAFSRQMWPSIRTAWFRHAVECPVWKAVLTRALSCPPHS